MDTLDYSERKDLKPALLIINPVAGKRMVLRNVAQIIRVLMDAGYKVTTMIKDLYKIKPLHMKVTADGVTHEDDYIFGAICNTASVAGTITLPSAMVDTADGVFEVLLVKMPKTMLELDMIIRGLLSQDYSCPNIDLFQAKELDIENPPELEWSLDGEASGVMDKAHVSVIPRFLNLRG